MKTRLSTKAPKRPPLFLGQKVLGELRILMRLAATPRGTVQNGPLATTSSF